MPFPCTTKQSRHLSRDYWLINRSEPHLAGRIHTRMRPSSPDISESSITHLNHVNGPFKIGHDTGSKHCSARTPSLRTGERLWKPLGGSKRGCSWAKTCTRVQ